MGAIAHNARPVGLAASLAALLLHVLLALTPVSAPAISAAFAPRICHIADGAKGGATEHPHAPAAPGKACVACPVCVATTMGGLLPVALILPGAPLLLASWRPLLPPSRAPPSPTILRPHQTGPPA